MSGTLSLFPDLREQESPRLLRRRAALVPLILDRVKFDPFNGCWLCQLGVAGGAYPHVRVGRHMLRVHRVMYEHFSGPVGTGLHVLHRCDVPRCCNPGHLWVGTQADNMADRDAKRRWRGGRGGVLSPEQVREIRASGDTLAVLAGRYGVNGSTVYKVRAGQRYRHVE